MVITVLVFFLAYNSSFKISVEERFDLFSELIKRVFALWKRQKNAFRIKLKI